MPAAVLPPLATRPAAPATPVAPAVRRRPASVFLPKEHGSWSLALEPLALGLLIAPSAPGGALAVAATAGFFARRPARLALDASAPAARRRPAFVALTLFGVIGVTGLALAIAQTGLAALWPLGLALPFAALFAGFDARGEGRSLFAEVAGAVAFATLPAACATLSGWSHGTALALGAVALTRSVPTVLLVRSCLRARKSGEVRGTLAGPLAATIALFGLALLARAHVLPSLALLAAALLLVRAVVIASPVGRTCSARRLGLVEVFVGVAFVALTVLAFRTAY